MVGSGSWIVKVIISCDVAQTVVKGASNLRINDLNVLGCLSIWTIEVSVVNSRATEAIKNFIVN